jgi:hypothetical protein
MPATATGRGAQVLVDPSTDTAKAIRGAYANTLELNTAKVRGDVEAGTFPPSNTTSDGTTNTGVPATDPIISGAAAKIIGQSSVAVSHTGDTASFSFAVIPIPANAMGPNGMLRVTTLWTFTGTLSKNAQVTFSNTPGGTGLVLNQAITTGLSVHDVRDIRNANSVTAQKILSPNTAPYGVNAPSVVALAVNTAAACYVNMAGVMTNAGESMTLEAYTVELLRLN